MLSPSPSLANPPNPPTALILTQPTPNTLTLTWQPPRGGLLGYHIYQDHDLVATIPSTGPLTWSGTLPGFGTFAFAVRAYNADGDSSLRIHRTVTWLDPRGRAGFLRQWGITWTFSGEHEFGQFANGDFWVKGPVSIVSINPPCQVVNEDVGGTPTPRTINGGMLDPYIPTVISNIRQGYDSLQRNYGDSLNVARGVGPTTPLVIDGGHSLVSAISYAPATGHPVLLRVAAVLTVLANTPAPGSFRPSFASPSKAIQHNASELDFGILRRLPPPSVAPNLADITSRMERVFLDHVGADFDQEGSLSPQENMDDYGRDVSTDVGDAVLTLNLDFEDTDKAKLFIAMVQMGLDLYGVTQVGSGNTAWRGWGGHFAGRKLPILLAGLALHDAAITNVEATFAEDDLTYYFDDPRLPMGIRGQFSWTGSRILYKFNYHWTDPQYGQIYEHKHPATWTKGTDSVPYITDARCEAYRTCCTARAWVGIALSVHLIGAQAQWRNQSFLDYMDRWMHEDITPFLPILNLATGGSSARDYRNGQSEFSEVMWQANRNLVDVEPPSAPAIPVVTGDGSGPRSLIWNRCGDNVGGVGYRIFRNGVLIATVYENFYTDATPPPGSLSYRIQAFDWTGNVNPSAPVISRFASDPATIIVGESSTLSWTVVGADTLSLDHGIGIITGATREVTPASTTTYTLTVDNGIAKSTAQTVVTVLPTPPIGATRFYPLTPCRALDTRNSTGPDAANPEIAAHDRRVFTVVSRCGIPLDAKAISANLTVVNAQAAGELRITGNHLTTTSTSVLVIPPSRARANNATIQLATEDAGMIAVTNDSPGTVHFILDVNGYFR